MNIKKGDNIIIIKGKQKGQKVKVLQAIPRKDSVICEGVNICTFNKKPRTKADKGSQDKAEAPIHVSNVALLDKKGKATRVKMIIKNGKKIRVTCKTGETI